MLALQCTINLKQYMKTEKIKKLSLLSQTIMKQVDLVVQIKTKKLDTAFLNKDYTNTMVPLFAGGPQAKKFIGTFHNNERHHKIISMLEIKIRF